ncbi:MAG: ABC transporter ATP-binding protein [Spirochaetes bacterium]|nr:ABC transporter ATP-binding protein [Spirochaetota bacterium]
MLEVKNLSYKIGNFFLNDINLSISKNEYSVLLGRSGSGKTTLIKCISGLYKVHTGKIFLHGNDITNMLPEDRKIGYVPQDYALFPHLNVHDNILFGIKSVKRKTGEITDRFDGLVKLLSVRNLLKRKVQNLSGGEKQKIALARALIVHPQVLLLDEPFSAIDHGMKVELWFEVKEILNQLNITVIHITHNLDEAHAIADGISVLINGKIEQTGSKDEIFLRPKTEQVALYQGIKNLYEGTVTDVSVEKIKIKGNGFEIVALKDADFTTGQKVKFSIRPQDIKIIKEGLPVRHELTDNILEGEIVSSLFYNDFCTIKLKSTIDIELRFPIYIYQRYHFFNGKKIRIGIWQPGINIFSE